MPRSVLIFGATRETGLEAARILAARGDQVTALVRPASDASELEPLGARIVRGDVLEPDTIDAAFASASHDAVIISIGTKPGETVRPDFEGSRNIVEAAARHGVRRVLLVTVIGAGDSRGAVAPRVLEVLGEVIALKTQAEEQLAGSGLDWTILRPGGLTSDEPTGTGIRTTDHSVMGVITRADLARLVVECLDDPGSVGETYHTIDPEIKWQAPLQRGGDLNERPPG